MNEDIDRKFMILLKNSIKDSFDAGFKSGREFAEDMSMFWILNAYIKAFTIMIIPATTVSVIIGSGWPLLMLLPTVVFACIHFAIFSYWPKADKKEEENG